MISIKYCAAALLVVGFVSGSAMLARAETTTCDLPNPSCTGLANVCKAYNSKRGASTARCDDYRSQCMASGNWIDRNCQRKGVAKK
jgi:hypothetical protein